MIRVYQAAHGGMVFHETLTKRQQSRRTRALALAVIVAVAGSTGVIQRFSDAHAEAAVLGAGSQR